MSLAQVRASIRPIACLRSGKSRLHGVAAAALMVVLRTSRGVMCEPSRPHSCSITVRVNALLANFFSGIGLPNR